MSLEPIKIRRKNNLNLLKEARKLASFDEFPMLRPDVDPQFHLSRNEVDQPFYLSGEKDMVIGQFGGASRVLFTDGPARYFDMGPGDFVYIPAGSAHRILTKEPGLLIRYKAVEPGSETVSWHCDACGTKIFQHSFDATEAPAQLGYHEGSTAFNATDRACKSCNAVQPPVDLSLFRWEQVAHTLLTAEPDEETGESA